MSGKFKVVWLMFTIIWIHFLIHCWEIGIEYKQIKEDIWVQIWG